MGTREKTESDDQEKVAMSLPSKTENSHSEPSITPGNRGGARFFLAIYIYSARAAEKQRSFHPISVPFIQIPLILPWDLTSFLTG